MDSLQFVPGEFITNLKYMGLGLLGTFLIIGIIIGVTMLFNYASNRLSAARKTQKDEGDTQNAGE